MTPISLHPWLPGRNRSADPVAIAVDQSKTVLPEFIEGLLQLIVSQVEATAVPGRVRVRLPRLVQILLEHLLAEGYLAAHEDALDLPKRVLDLCRVSPGRHGEISPRVHRDVPTGRLPGLGASYGHRVALDEPPQVADLVVLRFPHERVEVAKLVPERQRSRPEEVEDVRERFAVAVDEEAAVGVLRDGRTAREHHLEQIVRQSSEGRDRRVEQLAADVQLDVVREGRTLGLRPPYRYRRAGFRTLQGNRAPFFVRRTPVVSVHLADFRCGVKQSRASNPLHRPVAPAVNANQAGQPTCTSSK